MSEKIIFNIQWNIFVLLIEKMYFTLKIIEINHILKHNKKSESNYYFQIF